MTSKDTAESRPAKRRKLDCVGDVVVVVLKDDKRVTVQKNVLCKTSAFFKTACSGDWRESTDGVVKLQDYAEDEFLTYIHWLYTGAVNLAEDDTTACAIPSQTNDRAARITAKRLFGCYFMGDYIRDTRFCDALTDHFLQYVRDNNNLFDKAWYADFWSKIPPKSGMRRLLINLILHGGRDGAWLAECPADFVLEVAQAMLWLRRTGIVQPDPRFQVYGRYHDSEYDAI